EAAGLSAYEVSNHARPGHESRHNLLYWRYGEYAGAGPGAHGRIGRNGKRRALSAERHPETWRNLVMTRGHGMVEDAPIAPADQAAEYLLMGLRIRDGIDLARYGALAGHLPSNLADLEAMGLIARDDHRIAATSAGRRVLNSVIAELSS
ncbi:MAG: coproporphyrinogen III oxidase, partial [Parvibaculaceae bacterium]